MSTPRFDPGYGEEPFRTLAGDYPAEDVYPAADFRVEWGPIFHRGRLDGSARVLCIGQDPAQHETVARRILVGEAGHRIQGFLARLGIERGYVMVNTFLYSVYGQGRGSKHQHDARIVAYRNRWFDALLLGAKIEAVVALGSLADGAWQAWRTTQPAAAARLKYAKITHPTQPESAAGRDAAKHAAAIKALLQNWNTGLDTLHPLKHPDRQVQLHHYGTAFGDGDRIPIPLHDLPAGTPQWMATNDGWAGRTGATAAKKRATITVTVPRSALP